MLSYDPRALLAGGVIVLTPNTSPDVPAKAYTTTEHLMTAYLQADLKAQLGRRTDRQCRRAGGRHRAEVARAGL